MYFFITTAGTDTHSICYEYHQKALDIIEGKKVDPTFYPVVYGADPEDDWTSEDTWAKANPSLGITVPVEKVREACNSALQNPAEENTFRQLRLNQWVKQSVRWMPMHVWNTNNTPVDLSELEGRVCYGGLDLASTTDITAFVLVFPPQDEMDKYVIVPWFWIPEDNIEARVNRDHVPYDQWARAGHLQLTEGNVVHYKAIENFIEHLGERFDIRQIAYDRWGAVQMSQNLEELGFTVVPFGQGFKDMSPPSKEFMKLALEGKLAHGGHPVLAWMVCVTAFESEPKPHLKVSQNRSKSEPLGGSLLLRFWLNSRCGYTGWSTTSTSAPTLQATSNPTNKKALRKSTAWLPPSWP